MTPTFKPLDLPKPGAFDLDAYVKERGVPKLTTETAAEPAMSLPTDEDARPADHDPQTSRTKRPRIQRVPVEMPDYLADTLREAAAKQRCTVKYLILAALKDAGWAVKPTDLMEDGRAPTRPQRVAL